VGREVFNHRDGIVIDAKSAPMKVYSFGGRGHPEISFLKCRKYLVFSYQNNGLILWNPTWYVKIFLLLFSRNHQMPILTTQPELSPTGISRNQPKPKYAVNRGGRTFDNPEK
jgi:hypothetical protein